MAVLTKTAGDLTKEKDEALTKLDEIQSIQSRAEESLQRSSAQSEKEKHEYLEKIQMLQNENSMLTAKFDDLIARNEEQHTEFIEMKSNLEQQITVSLSFFFLLLHFFFNFIVKEFQRNKSTLRRRKCKTKRKHEKYQRDFIENSGRSTNENRGFREFGKNCI